MRPALCGRPAAPHGSPWGCWAGAAAPAPAAPAASACRRRRAPPAAARAAACSPRAACASASGACGAGCTACPRAPRSLESKSEKALLARNIGLFLFSTRPHNLPTLPNNKSPRNICTSNKNFARSYLRTLPTETFHRHPKSSKFLNENQFWLAICATVSARAHRPTYVMSLSHSSQMFCPGGKPPVLLMGASGRVTGACT